MTAMTETCDNREVLNDISANDNQDQDSQSEMEDVQHSNDIPEYDYSTVCENPFF